MKHKNPIIILFTILLSVFVGIACSEVRNAAAKPEVSVSPHQEYGVIDSGVISGPGSTAVTATFNAPFENPPVCTLAQRPNTVGTAQKAESAAATLSVVLMNVTNNEVTLFVHNTNAFPDSTLIHWHCIGQ